MFITSPFDLPEAVVAVAVEGVDSLKVIKGKKFPLNVDESEETTWQALSGRIQKRDNDNTLVRIYLGDGLDAVSITKQEYYKKNQRMIQVEFLLLNIIF